jgi:hypothetical protein
VRDMVDVGCKMGNIGNIPRSTLGSGGGGKGRVSSSLLNAHPLLGPPSFEPSSLLLIL